MIPIETPPEFQWELVGHRGRENLCRHDRVVAGPCLVQKPAVELPRLERLPQLEAAASEEGIDVVIALKAAHENLVELGRDAAAGLVGGHRGDRPLVERGGGLQVARRAGRIARGEEHGRCRRRMAGEPGLEGDVGGEGVAGFAGLREKFHNLRLGRVGGELRRLLLGRTGRVRCHETGGDREAKDGGVHGE